jgi:hypothetical protein
MRARRRSLGNIRFIGELYKLKMLTGRIMHECVQVLSRVLRSLNCDVLFTKVLYFYIKAVSVK